MTLEIISRGQQVEGQAGGRPSLLFIPGGFHDARCWDHHYLPWFAQRGWAAYAMSLRGHGQSPGDLVRDNPGLDDYVDDVMAAMDRIGGEFVLVGHSLGGVVSQMVRARDARVTGTVLLASSPMRPALGVALRMLVRHPISLIRSQVLGNMTAGEPAFVSFFYGPDLAPDLKRKYVSELGDESPRAMGELFKRPPPQTPDLETRPVLVVAGRGDWSIPMADQKWLAETFKAPLEVVPGAHNLMVDSSWEEGAIVIDRWLQARFG